MSLDPSRSVTLRRGLSTVGRRVFTHVFQSQLPVLRAGVPIAVFDEPTEPETLERSLRQSLDAAFEGVPLVDFIMRAYGKGALRSFSEVRGLQGVAPTQQTRSEFVQSLTTGEDTVRNLLARARSELRGINEEVVRQVLREVSSGIARGADPSNLELLVSDRIDKIGKTRFELFANDLVIRAHAEGQLDGFEELGVYRVQAQVEWVTAGDGRVCPKCTALGGRLILTIAQARGLIPRHPNCRCAWRLVESDKKFIRRGGLSRGARSALRSSISLESIAGREVLWTGADLLKGAK